MSPQSKSLHTQQVEEGSQINTDNWRTQELHYKLQRNDFLG